MFLVELWIPVVVNGMLGAVVIARIHAMYQRSKRILAFLVVAFLASMIATGVTTVIGTSHVSGEEFVLSGFHQCSIVGDDLPLILETWVHTFIWEILVLCLAVWIVFRELQQSPTGPSIGDCFTVLIKSHLLYFVAFAAVSCFYLGTLSPSMRSYAIGIGIYRGIGQIVQSLQMFVLGPRLILSVREYHAELVDSSDESTRMSTIAFQERVSTGDDV